MRIPEDVSLPITDLSVEDMDEDAYSCNECKKLFHMESLVVQAHDDGRPMEGFMCRPCHEASGKKEWWI